MGEWADGAFERLREQEGARHTQLQQTAEIRYQIRTNAPHLWKSVVREIRQEIADFHKKRPDYLEIDDQSEGSHEQYITLTSPAIIVQVVLDERPGITYTQSRRRPDGDDRLDYQGAYTFSVQPDHKVWLLDERDKPCTIADVKRTILKLLL